MSKTELNRTELERRIAELEAAISVEQHQMALRQSLLDALPAVVYATEHTGYLRVINQAFAHWAGHSAATLVDQPIAAFFPPDLLEFWLQQERWTVATGRTLETLETIGTGADARTYRSLRFPIRDATGALSFIGGMAEDITERKHAQQLLREQHVLLHAIIDNATAVIYVKTLDGRLLLVNQAYARAVGRALSTLAGQTEADLFPPALVAAWRDAEHATVAQGQPLNYTNQLEVDGVVREFLTTEYPLYDDQQQITAICGISIDVTTLRQVEQERDALRTAVIDAQRQSLRVLSVPIIPLANQILVVPLIGIMDAERANDLMRAVLQGIAKHAATCVILDVTGLRMVDQTTAHLLMQTASAAQLLGAEVVVTGISPEIAQTLVHIGADLASIMTPGTLQAGIAYAMGRRSHEQ